MASKIAFGISVAVMQNDIFRNLIILIIWNKIK